MYLTLLSKLPRRYHLLLQRFDLAGRRAEFLYTHHSDVEKRRGEQVVHHGVARHSTTRVQPSIHDVG